MILCLSWGCCASKLLRMEINVAFDCVAAGVGRVSMIPGSLREFRSPIALPTSMSVLGDSDAGLPDASPPTRRFAMLLIGLMSLLKRFDAPLAAGTANAVSAARGLTSRLPLGSSSMGVSDLFLRRLGEVLSATPPASPLACLKFAACPLGNAKLAVEVDASGDADGDGAVYSKPKPNAEPALTALGPA